MTSASNLERLIDTTLETFGAVDGLVPNAGIVRPGPVGTLRDTGWDDMVHTNLTGPFWLIRAAMPHLLQSRGAIVGVSSAASLRATEEIAGYNATKAGLDMLIQSVAVVYGPQGIRANVVCPGWTRTEMADMEMQEYGTALGLEVDQAYSRAISFVPSRRLASASEIAEVVAWLLSSKSSYINAAFILIDGDKIATDPGALALDPRDSFAAPQSSAPSGFCLRNGSGPARGRTD